MLRVFSKSLASMWVKVAFVAGRADTLGNEKYSQHHSLFNMTGTNLKRKFSITRADFLRTPLQCKYTKSM